MSDGNYAPATASRLESLCWARDIARDSISEADPDKRSPLIGQYRALLAEISELEGPSAEAPKEVNGLVVLQEELAKRRQSGTTAARGATRRRV